MAKIEKDNEIGNFIYSLNYKKTYLTINTAFVKDFRLKIKVNNFQINRTRSLNQSSENLELKINNSELVSRVWKLLSVNEGIHYIDLQIQVDNKYDETFFRMSFERDRIKLNIILKDNILIEELLKIVETSNRTSILNIEINLQGIEGLYYVTKSYYNVVSEETQPKEEIQPEFDIGVLHENFIDNLDQTLKESLTTYCNDQSRIYNGDLISFSIFDIINNKT